MPLQHVKRYQMLTNGSELVESTLKEVLPEFLNAEITLRTIGDVSQVLPRASGGWTGRGLRHSFSQVVCRKDWVLPYLLPTAAEPTLSILSLTALPPTTCMHMQAVEWLRCTYFYVRVRHNPGLYSVPHQPTAEALDKWLRDRLVLDTVRELAQHGLVSGPSSAPERWGWGRPPHDGMGGGMRALAREFKV